MPWASIAASVAGSLISGSMASDASGRAADAQGQASAAAIAEQKRQYDQTRTDTAPWRDTGSAAQRRLAVLLGLQRNAAGGGPVPTRAQFTTPASPGSHGGETQDWFGGPILGATPTSPEVFDQAGYDRAVAASQVSGAPDAGYGDLNKRFTLADRDADPVYQSGLEFGLREGEGGINARALAGGMYDSGATLKALTRFGTDYGSTKANESRNRFVSDQDTTYNRLAGVSGSGQTATAQTVAANTSGSNNISELLTGAGNARAAGIVGGANAWAGAAGGINNSVNNWQNNQTLQKLIAGKTGQNSQQPFYDPGEYSEGGIVRGPGSETSDSIPIRVSDGEYVIPAEVVKKKGVKYFQRLLAENRAH